MKTLDRNEAHKLWARYWHDMNQEWFKIEFYKSALSGSMIITLPRWLMKPSFSNIRPTRRKSASKGFPTRDVLPAKPNNRYKNASKFEAFVFFWNPFWLGSSIQSSLLGDSAAKIELEEVNKNKQSERLLWKLYRICLPQRKCCSCRMECCSSHPIEKYCVAEETCMKTMNKKQVQ